jgi:hypothetical protein
MERKKLDEIERKVAAAESVVLRGFKYPHGRVYNSEEDIREKRAAIPLVVDAYKMFKDSGCDDRQLISRIHFLARCLIRVHDEDSESLYNFVLQMTKLDQAIIRRICEIAAEGRQFGRSDKICHSDRERAGRLFFIEEKIYAASIQDPKTGCSASICSNCFEPGAFADHACGNCGLYFIGPFRMPTLDEWIKMNLPKRIQLVNEVYSHHPNRGRLVILQRTA